MKNKFRCGDIMGAYWKAVDAFRVEKFASYRLEILQRYHRVCRLPRASSWIQEVATVSFSRNEVQYYND